MPTLVKYMENRNPTLVTDASVPPVKRDKFRRRGFLGMGSAALALAGIVPGLTQAPPELVMAHLQIDKTTLDALPKEEVVIVPA